MSTNQKSGCFHAGPGRAVSKNGIFHASAWPSEVDDALDAVDGASKKGFFQALEDVGARDAADGGFKDGVFQVDGALHVLCDLPGACTGSSCHVGLAVDRGPMASARAWGLFHCFLNMADPPEVEMPELCLIHCWTTNFPILVGYAADPR